MITRADLERHTKAELVDLVMNISLQLDEYLEEREHVLKAVEIMSVRLREFTGDV